MPTYRYRAYDRTGSAVAGDIEAAGAKAAAEQLKDTGLFPIDVTSSEPAGRWLFKGFPAGVLALATRQLAVLLKTGTNLTEALGVLADNLTDERLKSIILKVKASVLEGSTLARALEAHPAVFSPFYRGLVNSGEATGALDQVLARLADYLETRARIVRDLKTALIYPVLMSFVGAGVLAFLFIFVIPKITRIFEDTESTLPLITLLLIGITNMVRYYWPLIIAAGVGGWFLFRRYRHNPGVRERLDRLILRLPLVKTLAVNFYISNLTRTLGSLLSGGVHLLRALEITRQAVNNTVFNRIIDGAIKDCTEGAPLSTALKRHAEIPSMTVHMISVGERGGNVDEMLLKTADVYEEEFTAGLTRAVTLMEPLLILAMGVVVGFIVLAILLPIFELNQIVR
jgi:general secretion pathway protein F